MMMFGPYRRIRRASARWTSYTGILAVGLVASAPVHAADRQVEMQVPSPTRKGVAALPLIARPVDDAERRINIALRRLDATLRKALPTCKGDAGAPANWERSIEVPMRGPGYISFVITDDAFCGGAHPSTATMAIVYDLRTGAPVDWTRLLPASLTGKVALTAGMDGTKMVTLASKRLYALFLSGYDLGSGTAEDQASCKDAVENIGSDGPPAMMVWPNAKQGGLALQYDLSHVVQACAVPVVVPAETLRAEGVQLPLLDAIRAAHWH